MWTGAALLVLFGTIDIRWEVDHMRAKARKSQFDCNILLRIAVQRVLIREREIECPTFLTHQLICYTFLLVHMTSFLIVIIHGYNQLRARG